MEGCQMAELRNKSTALADLPDAPEIESGAEETGGNKEKSGPAEPTRLSRAVKYTDLLREFILYLQEVSEYTGENISLELGFKPSWFSDIKNGKRSKFSSDVIASILGFGFNYGIKQGYISNLTSIKPYQIQNDLFNADDTTKFYHYVRYKLDMFAERQRNNGRPCSEFAGEQWLLIMFFEYTLVDIDASNRIAELLTHIFRSKNPADYFKALGRNEHLPKRYASPKNRIVETNRIYAEEPKSKRGLPLMYVHYDFESDIGKQNLTSRIELYNKGKIRLIDLFMMLYRDELIKYNSDEDDTIEAVCKILYSRNIPTYYHLAGYIESPQIPPNSNIYRYDFGLPEVEGGERQPVFLGLVDCFNNMNIAESDAEFQQFRSNFLNLGRTFMQIVDFDYGFIKNLSVQLRNELHHEIEKTITDFKRTRKL